MKSFHRPEVPSRAVRIGLAEDQQIVREGLKALVNAQPDLIVIGEAADGADAVALAGQLRPDVLVMDIAMPTMNGLEATAQLTREVPETRIVVLSVHEDRAYFRRLIAAGACGYVLKRSAAAQLIEAIRRVAAGGLYIDRALATRFPAAHDPSGGRTGDLTARELEILSLAAAGHGNREIASRLGISVKTVETHKTHINEKMGFGSRADLVAYAVRRGLLRGLDR